MRDKLIDLLCINSKGINDKSIIWLFLNEYYMQEIENG